MIMRKKMPAFYPKCQAQSKENTGRTSLPQNNILFLRHAIALSGVDVTCRVWESLRKEFLIPEWLPSDPSSRYWAPFPVSYRWFVIQDPEPCFFNAEFHWNMIVYTHRNPWSSRNFTTAGLIFGPLVLWGPQPVITLTVEAPSAKPKKEQEAAKNKQHTHFQLSPWRRTVLIFLCVQ